MTTALAYIDDACILSDTAAGFRTLLYRLNRFYHWAGLQVNNSKSAVFAYDFGSNTALPTDHLRLQNRPIPKLPLTGTYKYLGVEFSPGGSWAIEKARVRRKLKDCISALKGSPYLPQQLDRVVRACMLPLFRYGAALVEWTDRELDDVTRIWANARRLAWKLAPGSPNALHVLPPEMGGGAYLMPNYSGHAKCGGCYRCVQLTTMTSGHLLTGNGGTVLPGLDLTPTARFGGS